MRFEYPMDLKQDNIFARKNYQYQLCRVAEMPTTGVLVYMQWILYSRYLLQYHIMIYLITKATTGSFFFSNTLTGLGKLNA